MMNTRHTHTHFNNLTTRELAEAQDAVNTLNRIMADNHEQRLAAARATDARRAVEGGLFANRSAVEDWEALRPTPLPDVNRSFFYVVNRHMAGSGGLSEEQRAAWDAAWDTLIRLSDLSRSRSNAASEAHRAYEAQAQQAGIDGARREGYALLSAHQQGIRDGNCAMQFKTRIGPGQAMYHVARLERGVAVDACVVFTGTNGRGVPDMATIGKTTEELLSWGYAYVPFEYNEYYDRAGDFERQWRAENPAPTPDDLFEGQPETVS